MESPRPQLWLPRIQTPPERQKVWAPFPQTLAQPSATPSRALEKWQPSIEVCLAVWHALQNDMTLQTVSRYAGFRKSHCIRLYIYIHVYIHTYITYIYICNSLIWYTVNGSSRDVSWRVSNSPRTAGASATVWPSLFSAFSCINTWTTSWAHRVAPRKVWAEHLHDLSQWTMQVCIWYNQCMTLLCHSLNLQAVFYTFWNNATATTSTDIPWAKWDAAGGVASLESHIIAVQQSQSVTALAVR